MIWKLLTVILAAAVIVLIAVLLKIRAQLRDINEQLDFLYEKDTNMLLATDTNLADIGTLKRNINRFLVQGHLRRREAVKKEQMISDTYTNLSHDIRTPLTSLDGYFQLLREEEDEKQQEHYIAIIQERITSLKDMLEELFMFTKLKNDSFKLELSNCCVSRLLKQTVFSYYDEWKKQGIEPEILLCDETVFILANTQALRRVFQNIIKNALVHGQKSIRIEMKKQDDEVSGENNSIDRSTGQVCISISNDVENPGEIDVSKVFERFYKADEARSVSSSGLGLSIAKELVERMGGQIRAELDGNRFGVKITFEQINVDILS
ncbi:sensor histidine kinase [Agathobacter sp.]